MHSLYHEETCVFNGLSNCVKYLMMVVSISALHLAGPDLILQAATEAVGVTEDGPHLHFEATSGGHFRTVYTKDRIHLLRNEQL